MASAAAHPLATATRSTHATRDDAVVGTGSQTQTATGAAGPSQPLLPLPNGTLKLRGQHTHTTNGRQIHWAEDVVDNEGLGRKRSKVCCIYHRPRAVGESSDESSSDSDDSSSADDDSGADDGSARPSQAGRGHANHDGHACGRSSASKGKRQAARRTHSPNAYEKMPKPKGSKATAQSGS